MSKYREIAKYFEENSTSKIYFESQASAKALRQIRTIINEHFPQMIFLLGSPGSGKTFLLHHLVRSYGDEKKCLVMENPFLTPTELLKKMLNFMDIDHEGKDVESMRLEAIEVYRDKPHVIMIDEAQLSHAPLREFIRILSDSKVFWFLVAMHTQEGESMLKNPHFLSRAHQVVYMNSLEKDEIMPYISQVLKDCDYKDIVFTNKDLLINGVQKYAKGNFRNFKKLCYEFFLLIDYANNNDRLNFVKPTKRIMQMAAIKAGLAQNVRRSDFDDLVSITSTIKSIKNGLIITAILAFISAILFWRVNETYDFSGKILSMISKTEQNSINTKKQLHAKENLHVEKETSIKDAKTEEKSKNEKLHVKNDLKVKSNQNAKDENSQLAFYPPSLNKQQKREEVTYEPMIEETIDLETSLDIEPNFLDDEIELKKNRSILKVTNTKRSKLQNLEKEYEHLAKYETALEIAQLYYSKKAYQNASIWAKKANTLDSKQETPWILYAQSQHKMGSKQDAIASLRLFLKYKFSQKAQNLLNKWTKDKK